MKIDKIEVFDCRVFEIDPTVSLFNPVLVRIHTDEGLSGIGESGMVFGNVAGGAAGMIRDFARLLIGLDPRNTEAIWDKLFRNYWCMGGGPVLYSAMSALDIALWDIKGKALGVPIYELLGGRTRTELRCYASQIQFGWGPQRKTLIDPADYAESALAAVAQGYDCVKVNPVQFYGTTATENALVNPKAEYFGLLEAKDIRRARERVQAIREAVGPDVGIIIELHSVLGVNAALQIIQALEEFDIFYCEEAVHPLNVDNMALLARKTRTPIASGERIYTRWGYRPFLEAQALAVIQPDACLAGGITEVKKIADYAAVYDTTVQVHVYGTSISTLAAAHIETSISNFIIHESHTLAFNPTVADLCIHDYQAKQGRFTAPELPGLGQELNDDLIRRFPVTVIK